MSSIAFLLRDVRGSKNETPQTRVRSGTLPSGITAKMDSFARHVAEGLSLADAYRQSFNTAKMKPRTVSNDASRLVRHPGVTAAIAAYMEEFAARNRLLALQRDERIWEGLWGLVENDEVPPAVKVKALDLAARLCGMFGRPRNEAPLSAAEIEAELVERLKVRLGG
jgi:hypothetical protein